MTTHGTLSALAFVLCACITAPKTAAAQDRIDPNTIDFTALATSVSTPDFTFRVPVEMRQMPTEAAVLCYVRDRNGANVGIARSPIPLDANGDYKGTVTVGIDAARGLEPADAVRWACWLWGRRSDGPWGYLDPDADAPELRPGTETGWVRGTGGAL